jgi:tetratricopeptide (TPR) repeat protein
LTTRQQVTEPVAQAIVLDMLSDDEGILFLLKRTKRLTFDAVLTTTSTSEMVIARTITQQLGGLPLALDQAGAYIAENRCSLSHYLNLFKQQQRVLLQRRGTVPSDHRQSVTTTFSLAFEQLQQKNKPASDLLTVCAFLAPDAIPLEIITEGAAHLGMVLGTAVGDTLQLDKMLETLQACSLVQRDPEEKNLAIHRLVQTVLQDTLQEAERYSWAERTMLAINAAFPEVEHKTWAQCKRLLPHALLAAQYIKRQQIISKEAGRLLSETAVYLRDRSRYSEAEPLFLQALQIFEQLSGQEHLDVVTPLNNLALLYTYQGKYEQAELHYKRALQICKQQLQYSAGDALLHGLATLYVSLGKYELAEPLFLQALEIRKQQLGVEHLDVAVSLNNLASLYHYQGKYEQAEPLYLQALEICEQQPDHPNLAYLLSNLAAFYLDQDKYVKAEPLLLRSRQICEQQLGLEHHGMAYPLNGLAEFYYKQGKYVEAEPLYQQALQICEQQLGPEHSDVAASLHGLANLYRDQGKYVEAEPLYRRALCIRELVLGSEQSETANIMHDFTRFHEVRGNREEARGGYIRTLLIREQTLGVHHPKTRETRKYLIALLHTMGHHEEATRLEAVQQKP